MKSEDHSPFSDVSNIIQNHCSSSDCKDPAKDLFTDVDNFDKSICDLDEFEEVFADHILMGNRLRKTLYSGDLNGCEDLPDHPPIALTGLALELFSKAAPNYGLDILDMDYVSAVSEAAKISPCAMIVAMIYLERLRQKDTDYLDTVSPSGLFVVTMLVASKFLFEDEDDCVSNQMWSEILNYDIKELNSLEQHFLFAIEWKVFVSSSEYYEYLCHIEKKIVLKHFLLHNWLSYSDLSVVMMDPVFQKTWKISVKNIFKAVLVWTFGYIASACIAYVIFLSAQKLKATKSFTQESTFNVFKSQEISPLSPTTITHFHLPHEAALMTDASDNVSIDNLMNFEKLVLEQKYETCSLSGNCYLFLHKRDTVSYREIRTALNLCKQEKQKEFILNSSFLKKNITWVKLKKPACTVLEVM